ncbi:MAG: alpha/beta hydrolase, partial [Anaerolineae bacterium]
YSAYSTEMITYLPRMIRDTAQGDYELLSWMLGATISPKIEHSIGMYFSVNCHEEIYATTPEDLAADYETYPYAKGFVEEVIFGSPETLFEVCEVWGAAPFDTLEGQPVESEIPTLILVGEYDPVTPPPYARQVAEALSNVYAYEFPGQGHVVGLGQSPCAMEMVEDFLEDPDVPPDDICMAEMGGPDFVR